MTNIYLLINEVSFYDNYCQISTSAHKSVKCLRLFDLQGMIVPIIKLTVTLLQG